MRASIWLAATVRALTAERRATLRARIASARPSADFGAVVASPLSTARAAASASTASVLPRRRQFWRLTSTTCAPADARWRVRPAP